MVTRALFIVCMAAGLVLLGACGNQQPAGPAPATAASASAGPIASAIDRAMDRASAGMAGHNVSLSSDNADVPKAEITPQGDFLVAGKAVSLTAAQRTQVLAYRQLMLGIARQGIDVGKRGVRLGMDAARTAIAGALSGDSDQDIRQRVDTKASGIRKAAAKICDQLPAVMKSQQALAADLPAFKPYADLTPAKIDKCREDALRKDD